jgi:hypothetical protein
LVKVFNGLVQLHIYSFSTSFSAQDIPESQPVTIQPLLVSQHAYQHRLLRAINELEATVETCIPLHEYYAMPNSFFAYRSLEIISMTKLKAVNPQLLMDAHVEGAFEIASMVTLLKRLISSLENAGPEYERVSGKKIREHTLFTQKAKGLRSFLALEQPRLPTGETGQDRDAEGEAEGEPATSQPSQLASAGPSLIAMPDTLGQEMQVDPSLATPGGDDWSSWLRYAADFSAGPGGDDWHMG